MKCAVIVLLLNTVGQLREFHAQVQGDTTGL